MKFGIRFRFALWLVAALLPVSLSMLYVFDRLEDDVSAKISRDLTDLRDLEAARIGQALDRYQDNGRNLAADAHVIEFTSQVFRARMNEVQDGTIAGYDGFDEIDPFAELPLQQLAVDLHSKTVSTTGEVAALRLMSLDDSVLGETSGFDWTPTDTLLVERAIAAKSTVVGNAYRDSDGEDRVGVVVPVSGEDDTIVGVLLLENDLGPIVDLVKAHEGFGNSNEAHVVQATSSGDAEFITSLRFDRSAAFNLAGRAEQDLPSLQSLAASDGTVLVANDYRGEESIFAIKTIKETGWGLIVKVDRSEAMASVQGRTGSLKTVAILGGLGMLLGWAALLDPVARRLRRMSEAAERVSSGEYDRPLDDRSFDEIGMVARSIDRLAIDLATDIAVRSDIEDRLREQATHDATTGLYNRQFATSLMTDLAAAVDASDGPTESAFSLLFLDLDNFKSINDVHGHATGDAVLKMTGARLTTAVGDRGSVARWGGDEFVLVLPGISVGGAQDVAAEVQRALLTPISTDTGEHQIRASIGASTLRSGDSLSAILHTADAAMFIEKQGRSGARTVSPATMRIVERALESDDVEVWFQPLVSGNGASVVLRGAEALVRLRSVEGHVIEPARFLHDVERSYVGRDLDRRVLHKALGQVAEWIKAGQLPADFELSVNCCEALMRDGDTVKYIERTLHNVGLAPHNLMLEIGENSLMVQPRVISALTQLGVRIAIDNLGLSNSNVDRLLDCGASVAKVDRRWLHPNPAGSDDANQTVVSHLVSLCDSLGFSVVAEGVETTEQYKQMSGLGVSRFQGFLFSEPLPVHEFEGQFFRSA